MRRVRTDCYGGERDGGDEEQVVANDVSPRPG